MSGRVVAARAAARRSVPRTGRELTEWLGIASISGDPAHRADVRRAAGWVAAWLRGLTPDVRVVPAPAGEVVVARVLRAPASAGAGGPLVVYGHLDVRPAGPGWSSAPFVPTVRGGRLFARGASDDKGQLLAPLAALRAWVETAGGPPCDVLVVVDGAEEIGSPGLADALRRGAAGWLGRAGVASAVLVCDTRMAGPGRPTLTLSQRGGFDLVVQVDAGGRAVHAGRFGGAVHDPSLLLGSLVRRAGELVGGWRPPGPTPSWPDDAAVRRSAGRPVRRDPARRSTRCGALSVVSWHTAGSPGAVPTRSRARLDVRVPAGLDAAAARRALVDELRRATPAGVGVSVRAGSPRTGLRLRPPAPALAALESACRAAYGRGLTVAASGGSIPAVGVLAGLFGSDPLLWGIGPADDGAHGPDERLTLEEWIRGIDAAVVFLDRVARSLPHGGSGSVRSAAPVGRRDKPTQRSPGYARGSPPQDARRSLALSPGSGAPFEVARSSAEVARDPR